MNHNQFKSKLSFFYDAQKIIMQHTLPGCDHSTPKMTERALLTFSLSAIQMGSYTAMGVGLAPQLIQELCRGTGDVGVMDIDF